MDDTGSLKIQYEAARDRVITADDRFHGRRSPPRNVPAGLHEIYWRGYERGRSDGMNFEEALFTAAPAELEDECAAAWELGYRAGKDWARESRVALVLTVLERMGVELQPHIENNLKKRRKEFIHRLAAIREEKVTRSARQVLAPLPVGASIPDSEDFRQLLASLERFVPTVFAEIYPDWLGSHGLNLDGILPLEARKVGDLEFEIFGLCILIADQTTTPIRLRLQLMPQKDKFSWGECRVGEAGEHGMVRRRWGSHAKDLHALEGRLNEIDWVYRATFGKKEI